MSVSTADPPRKVAILAYDSLCAFEFGIAVEIFSLERPELEVPWYECRVCALNGGPMDAAGGMSVTAPYGPEVLDWADTIIIPGWSGTSVPVPQQLRNVLSQACKRGARLVSICSGAFVLAAAGVLDGRRAVTHWRYAELLQAGYPRIHVEQDALYIEDANLFTSAGSAAGLDLCLHIVNQDYGSKIANAVARRLVLPAHRDGGQTQFIPSPVSGTADGLAPFLDWLRGDLVGEHSVRSMARKLGQSERTFIRKFHQATGTSPHAWLTAERIRRARELLETTNLPSSEVAARSGFVTPETFRHHFRRTVGAAPSRYRAAFRAD